jgi:hypothetical protein
MTSCEYLKSQNAPVLSPLFCPRGDLGPEQLKTPHVHRPGTGFQRTFSDERVVNCVT